MPTTKLRLGAPLLALLPLLAAACGGGGEQMAPQTPAASAPPHNGRDAILETMRGILDHAGEFKGAPTRVWTTGNTLAIEYVMTVTKGGKQASFSNLEIFTFNDDALIVTDHEYADAETFMEQTGMYNGQTSSALSPVGDRLD